MPSEPPQICGSAHGNETPSSSYTVSEQQPKSQQQFKNNAVASQQQQRLYPKLHMRRLYSTFSNSNTSELPNNSNTSSSIINNISSPMDHHTNFHPHFTKGEGVPEPMPTDVICGRGKMTASHPANRRFRELVDSHKASYQNSKRRDEKTRITCELVDKLRGEGRFVLFDPSTKLWYEVSEEYAREKVSHSLRSRSSSEQRNTNNSIHILSNGNVNSNKDSDTKVTIAPRRQGTARINSSHAASPVVITSMIPSTGSSSNSTSNNSAPNNGGISIMTTKKSASNTSGVTSIACKQKTTGAANLRKKIVKTIPHKAHSTTHTQKSKHSVVRPGLDETVKRLICVQQELLRGMIQKETERFTSAAAMGPPPRPMPLSFRAEASAVSTLTASLPKMGTVTAMAGNAAGSNDDTNINTTPAAVNVVTISSATNALGNASAASTISRTENKSANSFGQCTNITPSACKGRIIL